MDKDYLQKLFIDEAKPALNRHGTNNNANLISIGTYDEYWDSLQLFGEQTNYHGQFCGNAWTNDTFKPKYDLKIKDGAYMFIASRIEDLRPETIGVAITLLNGCILKYVFMNSMIKYVGEIDSRICTSDSNTVFYSATELQSVDKFILNENMSYGWSIFYNCTLLTDIVFEGVVAKTINLQYSPLSVPSMVSLMHCLKNHTGTSSEFKETLTLTQDCWTRLEESGPAPDGGTWKEYVDRLGWLT